jgi:hypothetical protein
MVVEITKPIWVVAKKVKPKYMHKKMCGKM